MVWNRDVLRFIVYGVGRRVAFMKVEFVPDQKNLRRMFVAYPTANRTDGVVGSVSDIAVIHELDWSLPSSTMP